MNPQPSSTTWSVDSWREKLLPTQVRYDDPAQVEAAVQMLRSLPPLVTSFEIERLRELLAGAERGERFLLQGGDCAESFDDCRAETITAKLKILMQMSLVLASGTRRPVIRVGRFAGQYAKPRSSATETRAVDGAAVELPSYFGDLVNEPAFTAAARRPDPWRMVQGYTRAALTVNFIRALVDGGFADMHHPEYWDLDFVRRNNGGQQRPLLDEYEQMAERLSHAIEFAEAVTGANIGDLDRVEFFTSHEGLNLHYESAQTRTVPRRDGYFDLTTHLPWIGKRNADPDGAHVEFFSGVRNPVGVKISADTSAEALLRLSERLNPDNEPGKLVLITRFGAANVQRVAPNLILRYRAEGRRGLWVCDPMHANTMTTGDGVKTRRFDDVLAELEATLDAHASAGGVLGGVHFELTGENVTECVGGASGVTEADLNVNYASLCDPRLNYEQALEVAFLLARRLSPARGGGRD